MKIIITGASGFIGTNLLQHLVNHKYEVKNIDINPPRNTTHQPYWEQVDITDLHTLTQAFVKYDPDYIIHLAARTDLDGKSLEDYKSNTIGVYNTLKAAESCTRLRKILITSSMLVCRAGYIPTHFRDYCPPNNYGISKVETENIVWKNKPQCDWAILRPTSIWGPWFEQPYRNFFDMVRHRLYFHIADTTCTKTFGYIGNTTYQIEQILINDTTDETNKVFYLGDNPPMNIRQWADQIAAQCNHKNPTIPYPIVKFAACFGDFLLKFGIHPPMTSFRLCNMSTDNILNLDNTYQIAPNPPYSQIQGIKETLSWMQYPAPDQFATLTHISESK